MDEFETSLKDLIENSPEKEKLLKSLKREIEKRVQVNIYIFDAVYPRESSKEFMKCRLDNFSSRFLNIIISPRIELTNINKDIINI